MDLTWEITHNEYSYNEVKARNKNRNYESMKHFPYSWSQEMFYNCQILLYELALSLLN